MIECRTIKELCSVVVDCPHSTPTWTAEGKIVVRSNNIKNGRIDFPLRPIQMMNIFSSE